MKYYYTSYIDWVRAMGMNNNIDEFVNVVGGSSKGVIISIFVKPDSPKEELVFEGNELIFYTMEPPVKGRANAALIRFFAKILGIPRSRISIIYGKRDRLKKILIMDTTMDYVVEKLRRYFKEYSKHK